MGKKGKGNKLAKMSEEERARYLQLRADIEEEARRRKMQLLALYMKNKLKREEAFSRLNLAKINQEWRTILRQVKCEELRKEIVGLEKFCREALERKDNTIRRLLNDLDVAEDTYATLQQSHMEILRKMLECQSQRTKFFAQVYESNKDEVLRECEEDMQKFEELSGQAQEQLECVKYQLEDRAERQQQENHERHLQRVDDLKSTMQLRLEEITRSREAVLESLWQEFQEVLSGYVRRTESFHAEYMDLKERDDESTAIMRDNCREIERLSDHLANLRLHEAETTERSEIRVRQLTRIRDELADELAAKKQAVEAQMRAGAQRIKAASVESYQVLKKLQGFATKGEKLLQLATICRKFETEREKVLPRGPPEGLPSVQAGAVPVDEDLQPPEAMKELPLETWHQMENFWRRVNHVAIDVACLREEKAALAAQNGRLKRALQEHLAELSIARGSNAHINDYLAKRPNSMRVDRVQQVDLAQGQNQVQGQGRGRGRALGASGRARERPVTTEANLTNAVRSKRLAEGRRRLPKIVTIVNW